MVVSSIAVRVFVELFKLMCFYSNQILYINCSSTWDFVDWNWWVFLNWWNWCWTLFLQINKLTLKRNLNLTACMLLCPSQLCRRCVCFRCWTDCSQSWPWLLFFSGLFAVWACCIWPPRKPLPQKASARDPHIRDDWPLASAVVVWCPVFPSVLQ